MGSFGNGISRRVNLELAEPKNRSVCLERNVNREGRAQTGRGEVGPRSPKSPGWEDTPHVWCGKVPRLLSAGQAGRLVPRLGKMFRWRDVRPRVGTGEGPLEGDVRGIEMHKVDLTVPGT